MKHTIRAIRAAIHNPRRVLACLRACEGVDLAVIEVHGPDYTLEDLHQQVHAAKHMARHDQERLQQLVAERNHQAALARQSQAEADALRARLGVA